MPEWMTALIAGSMLVLCFLAIQWARANGNWWLLSVELAALSAFAWFLHVSFNFPFGADLTAKGPNDVWLAVSLGICMVLGMAARFFYAHFEQPKRKRARKIDWGLFVAPVFASPIIFLPLLAAFQSVDIDLAKLTVPKLMIFFVAFENGFFWKAHFDSRQHEVESGGK